MLLRSSRPELKPQDATDFLGSSHRAGEANIAVERKLGCLIIVTTDVEVTWVWGLVAFLRIWAELQELTAIFVRRGRQWKYCALGGRNRSRCANFARGWCVILG